MVRHFSARGALLGVIGLGASLVTGCYDSRWGEAKRVQQHNAAHATPATLQTSAGEGDAVPLAATRQAARAYRIRAYAMPAYSAQTVDWRRHVTELIEDADRVLVPSMGVRLEVESFREWPTGEQNLEAALANLKEKDDGRDVDWVVGFAGGLSRATQSFHELGMADVVGKYIVVRASREVDEQGAIDRAFDELKEEDRNTLVRARMRHRATAVFLHEVGHTLGAIHARDERDLMHPQYDTPMEAYGPASASLMKAELLHRDESDPKGGAEALLVALGDGASDAWVEGERESLEMRLRGIVAAAPAAAGASTAAVAEGATTAPTEKPLPKEIEALSPEIRARFADASRALDAGDVEGALAKARPLFESERDVYAVQDLRCKIALARNQDWTETRGECERLMKLSTGGKK
jgi:hypothetical protein